MIMVHWSIGPLVHGDDSNENATQTVPSPSRAMAKDKPPKK